MSELAKTPLFDLHEALGAKMVPFAGYAMPVQYPLGVKKEHLHTRSAAGLFDVSHMGQVKISSATLSLEELALALEKLIPVDILSLQLNQQRYGFFTLENGGILDDLIITKREDHFLLVVNAGCKVADIEHLKAHLTADIVVEELVDLSLLALQGPQARTVLTELFAQAASLKFMTCADISFQGVDCLLSCCGYTGEDGFEISVPNAVVEVLAKTLLDKEQVEAIGLGARDSLRLEAGLCLYGQDLTVDINPVDAGLLWAIQKVRRTGGERAGGFLGADKVLNFIENGAAKKRVMLLPQGKAPVRAGCAIVTENGEQVGEVCSGGFGPSLDVPVAMAYINSEALDQPLFAELRKKLVPIALANKALLADRYVR